MVSNDHDALALRQLFRQRKTSPFSGASTARRTVERVMLVWLEKAEDLLHFPAADLVGVCDDGSGQKGEALTFFFQQFEPQLVRVAVRGQRTK